MRIKFSLFLFIPQVIFVILFGILVQYDPSLTGAHEENKTSHGDDFKALYPMFQDVHVMIFIGFGFLMTFLQRYGFGSVGFNFMLAALVIQWAILMRGFLELEGGKIYLNLESFLNADFACGAVLISFGAVLGVLNPVQLVVMAIMEVVIYAINEYIILGLLQINDIGGSLVIHAFGAYFGLSVSKIHWKKELSDHPNEGSVYHSDLFAMIGTIFLWLFWPSFNAAPAAGTIMAQRAVMTTVLSLSAATVTTFALSPLLDKKGKISMVHIQNSTLAGGVAVGSLANLQLGPLGAIIVGFFAGILSVLGYTFLTPILQRSIKLHDTCGVNNLHGMPGIFSAIVATIVAQCSTSHTFSESELNVIYPRSKDENFTFSYQAKMQLAGLAVTLGMALVGGALTGFVLRIPLLAPTASLFEDFDYWQMDDPPPKYAGVKSDEGEEMIVMEKKTSISGNKEEKNESEDSCDGSSIHEQTPIIESS